MSFSTEMETAIKERRFGDETALHGAARGGHEQVVARLLAACPDLITTTTAYSRETALHFAAQNGHDKVVALLLAAGPPSALVDAETSGGFTALRLAVAGGHHKVVAQLLPAMNNNPSSTASIFNWGRAALSSAARLGHAEVFTQLLAAYPELLDNNSAALHNAASKGHDNIVAQIVAQRPEFVSKPNELGRTALMCAAINGHEQVAERLLAIQSEEGACCCAVPSNKYTLLHAAVRTSSREFVAKVWRMNPRALRAACQGATPFQHVVQFGRNDLIELFQWSLSLDEIVRAFKRVNKLDYYEERCRPLMERQCECLLESLHRDVAKTVFEYIGFELKRIQPPCLANEAALPPLNVITHDS